MKFTGEIRIPEVDHPGVPATILLEDNQIEVVLDGESLGRWSLYDVRARRLVSAAFQLDLEGEEVTFIADEPIDFAYRGVEHMAETWARFNDMKAPRRMFAVRKTRDGVKPSRVGELRAAMEANLNVQRRGFLGEPRDRPDTYPRERTPTPETTVAQPEPAVPTPGETTGDEMAKIEAEAEEARRLESQRAEAAQIEEARAMLELDRARLEEERSRLEELRREAEERDARRIEAFRLEMARLETERAEQEKREAERAEEFAAEMKRLQAERESLQILEAERKAKEDQDAEGAEALRAQIAEMERLEAERVERARLEMEAVEQRRQELERRETERAEEERLEMERLEAERLEAERLAEVERLEAERLARELAAAEAAAAEAAAAEAAAAEAAAVEEPEDEDERGMAKELISTSADADDESAKDLVVDLGVYEETPTEPDAEPALAGASREKSGFMGAVRSAFTRNGKNHEHEFVTAPGGIGISRSICKDCGYVSISASD